MKPIEQIIGKAAVLEIDNIDTDQIIPAEHLKITDKEGLGKHLFSNWRFNSDGTEIDTFVLNQSATRSAEILIAGDNFACGSSREHAPWSLLDFGIKVVISSRIADIFSSNAIKNGLLPIVVDKHNLRFLMTQNSQIIAIDLLQETITAGQRSISFKLEPFSRYCFLNGMDQLDFLLGYEKQINYFEEKLLR